MLTDLPGLSVSMFLALVAVGIAGVLLGGYALRSHRAQRDTNPDPVEQLRDTAIQHETVALVLPDGYGIDELAAAVGLSALLDKWGVSTSLYAMDDLTTEDAKTFKNMFDIDYTVLDDNVGPISDQSAAIVVGGGGPAPTFGMTPPVIGVIRHRPSSEDDIIQVIHTEYGATSTIVAELLDRFDVALDQRLGTALLYGIRAGTHEFRRADGNHDYRAAGNLHEHADLGRIDDLRSPSMGGETFDVIGDAILNRERDSSFVVANVGEVATVSTLEEAADMLLRLEGASATAVFGIHEENIVISCRSDEVRVNALDLLEAAFGANETTGGTPDAAIARVPLGLFADLGADKEDNLHDLIDASARRTLFDTFESL